MTKNCFYQISKLINLYNRLEKILSNKYSIDLASADLNSVDLSLADLDSADLAPADLKNGSSRTNIFIPIEVHNELILDICFIEDNYLCFNTEKCKHCKKINNIRFKYININGIKIRLSIWIENEMLV